MLNIGDIIEIRGKQVILDQGQKTVSCKTKKKKVKQNEAKK